MRGLLLASKSWQRQRPPLQTKIAITCFRHTPGPFHLRDLCHDHGLLCVDFYLCFWTDHGHDPSDPGPLGRGPDRCGPDPYGRGCDHGHPVDRGRPAGPDGHRAGHRAGHGARPDGRRDDRHDDPPAGRGSGHGCVDLDFGRGGS